MARRFSPDKTKQLILERAGSVRAVARRMDPSKLEQERASINKWLAGKHVPSDESAARLAAAIPCKVDELYEDTEEEDVSMAALQDRADAVRAGRLAEEAA